MVNILMRLLKMLGYEDNSMRLMLGCGMYVDRRAAATHKGFFPLIDSRRIYVPQWCADVFKVEQVLNVRVKERESGAGRKSRLGNLFKEPPSTAIKGLFSKEPAHELKESIKRPLTGLFRRPGSRSGSVSVPQKDVKNEIGNAQVEEVTSNLVQRERSVPLDIPQVDRQLIHESVARAPNVSVNRVAAMYQLDALNAKNAFLAKLDEIDLSLLSRYLCSEDEVKDEDVAWTWDYVFASITTEMREEWALDDGQDEDSGDERNRNN